MVIIIVIVFFCVCVCSSYQSLDLLELHTAQSLLHVENWKKCKLVDTDVWLNEFHLFVSTVFVSLFFLTLLISWAGESMPSWLGNFQLYIAKKRSYYLRYGSNWNFTKYNNDSPEESHSTFQYDLKGYFYFLVMHILLPVIFNISLLS